MNYIESSTKISDYEHGQRVDTEISFKVKNWNRNVTLIGLYDASWTLIILTETGVPANQPVIHTVWLFGNNATAPEHHRTQHETYFNLPHLVSGLDLPTFS